MEYNEPFFRVYLREELSKRVKANPQYSLRAFAKKLEIDPGALSRIISGKQIIALKNARHLIERLALSDEEKALFIQSALEEKTRYEASKFGYQIQLNLTPSEKKKEQ